MRQEEQRVGNEHPEAVRSEPVPVPPPGDRAGRTDVPEDALDDRGTFDDPAVADERSRTNAAPPHGRNTDRTGSNDSRDDDGDRAEFHEPGPVPTAFGATSVGGAVAASALASPLPEDEPDPRTESTAQPGDGAVNGPGRAAGRTRPQSSTGPSGSATTGPTAGRPAGPARRCCPRTPSTAGPSGGPTSPGRPETRRAARPAPPGTAAPRPPWSTRTPNTRRPGVRTPGRWGPPEPTGRRARRWPPSLPASSTPGWRRASGTAGGMSSCGSWTTPRCGRGGPVAGRRGHPGTLLGAVRPEEQAGRLAGRRFRRHRAAPDGRPPLPRLPGPGARALTGSDRRPRPTGRGRLRTSSPDPGRGLEGRPGCRRPFSDITGGSGGAVGSWRFRRRRRGTAHSG